MNSQQHDFINMENNGLMLNLCFIPEEIVAFILSFLDAKTLVSSCRLVCKQWQTIIDDLVWKIKIRNAKIECLKKLHSLRLKLSWQESFLIFSKQPFGRNLLQNNCGQLQFQHWEIMDGGSLGWSVESTPAGANPLPDVEDFESNRCCFATSYSLCEKNQLINLQKCGIPDIIMDEVQPAIRISEWYAGRFDCGCTYTLKAKLLDKNERVLVESELISKTVSQWHGRDWCKFNFVIKMFINRDFSNVRASKAFLSLY